MAEVSVYSELDLLLRRHECFYRDQSRVWWLRDGDRNTSFFHGSIKRRQYRNTILTLLINGVLSEDRPTIRDHIISYYSGLFSSDVSRVGSDLSIVDDVIPSLVTIAEITFLTSVPFADDIHDAVFAIDAASAPGPYGFSGSFYQRCWDVVGSDVVLAIQDFFITGVFFPGFGFSPQQFGFIRDRHIENCITLTSDYVNVLQKKCYGGNLAMKIDICKAFKTLDWSFLYRVFQAFGFSSVFVDWIDSILHSSRLSILFNRVPEGYFCYSRGVRQGDLLSQLLFGIAEDFLSRLLTRGTQKNPKHIMGAFGDYGDISSKLVNWGGRATLIRSVITSSFLHFFMIYKWPSSLLSLINRKLRNLLWSGSCKETKLVRVTWDHCCRPYSHGGFGLKDLRLLNGSLLRKFTWMFITSDDFVFSFLGERYLRHLQKPYRGVSSESADHIFLHCPLAVALREAVFSAFQQRVSTETWQSFFLKAMSVSFSKRVRILWKAVIHAVIRKGRPSKAPVIKSVIWSRPVPGWIKVNIDGAAVGFPGVGGCGGIFRNCRAFVKDCFAIPLSQVFAFEADLLAASLAINFARKYGWRQIWLENDSSYVVQLLSSRSKMVP
ncbi:hypothetical protein LWI28_026195 [Acer negundo]|uniref:Reverse transcriptase domain-containing protein n=1 Tax=Acer negundo TaxID=4023 RepID=A0AAD5NKS6_ACENE|nr:hypothetical protein LWI28_026195 [Acer negundo]